MENTESLREFQGCQSMCEVSQSMCEVSIGEGCVATSSLDKAKERYEKIQKIDMEAFRAEYNLLFDKFKNEEITSFELNEKLKRLRDKYNIPEEAFSDSQIDHLTLDVNASLGQIKVFKAMGKSVKSFSDMLGKMRSK